MSDKPAIKPIIFRSKHLARFSELDPYGHMNTAHYINYFLEHRFIGMRDAIGWDLKKIGTLPIAFVVRKITGEFKRSVRADQEFEITSQLVEVGGMSCTVKGALSVEGKEAATFEMLLVCLDKKTQTAVPWPDGVLAPFYED